MITITEPATLITDYLLAAFTGVLAWRLYRSGATWWAVAFAATAVAGLAGGTVHGFREAMGSTATDTLWLVAIEGLVVAAFAVVRGTLLAAPLTARAQNAASLVSAAAYLAYGVWIAARPRFVFAIAAYGAALIALVAVQLTRWRSSRQAARWLLSGVAVSVIAAAIQQSGWALHRHFNHNDLYHVVQAGAIWLLYRGARIAGADVSRGSA